MIAIIAMVVLLISSIIPIKLAIAYAQAPKPQAILILGGGRGREEFAAKFAKDYPNLDLWLSTGINDEDAEVVFQNAGISEQRVHLDRRATDTVTNFTTLVDDFNNLQIQHTYLITGDFHMSRARAIAAFVFGSRSIFTTPITVPTKNPRESWLRTLRDCGRSILWIATGQTGAAPRPEEDEDT
ncbi:MULTISPECIES: YdcF family protein [Pseudanabaena]|uniref:DUF218 domain-containing protein n=2 Tax=Pseudanabaena TaxID=1152 RepID=L8N3V4_9CYAN|nr:MULTISPECIES: ElyC/SanA/YdcF family protein [Pseudanabaena]ELS32943.1 protein of unknown function DUF218 [Pseudanabaena biceps PCC 7429]MDG3494821.1 YdcF family protein [Pseudanabaena catenata USMAC16]